MHTRVRRFHHPTAGWFCDVPDTPDTQWLGEATTATVQSDDETLLSSSSLSLLLRGRVLEVREDGLLLLSCGGLLASVTTPGRWRVHDAVALHLT